MLYPLWYYLGFCQQLPGLSDKPELCKGTADIIKTQHFGLRTMSAHFKYTDSPSSSGNDWSNLNALMPYLWEYRGRVLLALLSLVLAKVTSVGVPIILKNLVDSLNIGLHKVILLPVVLLLMLLFVQKF